MKHQMPLGDFLVAYLQKIGVTHLFGIPGDLVMRLFMRFGQPRGLKIITFSHEPGVGFAADGYARATGQIGVVCVTYGAGGLNMVNPVAGSFAERVPILVISGGPGEEERRLGMLIHHQAKEIESQLHVYDELTSAAKVIDNLSTAANDIDAVVQSMWSHRRPGYLEIHRDMVEREIPVPERLIAWNGRLPAPSSNAQKLEEAARETAVRLNAARAPLIIVGIECHRYRMNQAVIRLVERIGAPCVTTVLAKGAVSMDHPLYLGTFIGDISPQAMLQRVKGADLVLSLGTLLTDMNLGSRPLKMDPEQTIAAVDDRVDVSFHSYTDVALPDFVDTLLGLTLRRHRERVEYTDNLKRQVAGDDRPPSVNDVLWELNRFLRDKRDYLVVAESGDMLFAGLDVRVAGDTGYLAQGFYASMGFGVPGAIGAQIGTGKRPVVLCGDGAFQMTGPEIAQAPRHGATPIVILMNNGGWGIFRPVAERQDLLTIPPWPYAQLAQAWGGVGMRVQTVIELRDALEAAGRCRSFVIIEVIVDPHDLSPVTRKYIDSSVRHGSARRRKPTRRKVKAVGARR